MKLTPNPQLGGTAGRTVVPDHAEFDCLVGPHRRELRLHCYRMLGSGDEAEDSVQETLVRAWRGFASLDQREALRGWLYRIATNVCLDTLASRRHARRLFPQLEGPATAKMPDGVPDNEAGWLEPYPDQHLADIPDGKPGPEARYETHEAVRLAFVAVIQRLPPRQRAVVLLCDVMGWSAQETAALMGGSLASINSALQRARTTLARHQGTAPPLSPTDAAQSRVLDRYLDVWEKRDLAGFAGLLHQEAVFCMPPWRQWYRGRADIRRFFDWAWGHYEGFRLLPTAANRQPAFAAYSRQSPGSWRPHSIQLLEIQAGSITGLTLFMQPLAYRLFESFGLSQSITKDSHNTRQSTEGFHHE